MSIWDAFGKGRYKGFSREAGQLLDKAVELAGGLGCKKAGTGHLLWAMLQADGGPAARFLAGKNISELEVRRQLSAGRYASGLRKVVRSHEPVKLVDTLVVGAFIEARSCERFEALVPHLDEELGKLYFGLLKSEARHFQGYLKLAYQYGDAKDIAQVIERVRAAEQELIESPDVEFRFHSGVPASN